MVMKLTWGNMSSYNNLKPIHLIILDIASLFVNESSE